MKEISFTEEKEMRLDLLQISSRTCSSLKFIFFKNILGFFYTIFLLNSFFFFSVLWYDLKPVLHFTSLMKYTELCHGLTLFLVTPFKRALLRTRLYHNIHYVCHTCETHQYTSVNYYTLL
uniref:Uncharacterized protein n=1 Tax=Octopus bimaculoides TaxID=37653 RepID=A0A0L8FRW0_OCTBM